MERAQRTQDETLRRARELGIAEKQALAFLETMPPRYLLAHDSTEISQHLAAVMEHLAGDMPAGVHAFQPERPAAGFQGLVVLAPDRPGLLAMMCGILRAAGRNILAAQVYTTRDSLAVEIFELEPLPGIAPTTAQLARVVERVRRDQIPLLPRCARALSTASLP